MNVIDVDEDGDIVLLAGQGHGALAMMVSSKALCLTSKYLKKLFGRGLVEGSTNFTADNPLKLPEDDPIAVLIVQVGLNDKDAAFASLERAYELHSTAISTLKENPIFDSLRNDPRFADLLKRVGLAD